MRKNILIIAASVITCMSMVSCTKDNTKTTYSGPALIEFYPLTKTVYTSTVENTDSAVVQLVSAQTSANRNFTYMADTSSTAKSPADYEFTGQSMIPANSSFGAVYFKTKPATASKTLKIVLTGGDNLNASSNFKTATITISPTPVIFTPNTRTITPPVAGMNDTARVRLNVAAARFATPTPITYTVNPSSTAVEGVDYTFVSPKGVATVPPGASDALVVIRFNKVASQKKLTLDIATQPGISLTTATRTITWTINP